MKTRPTLTFNVQRFFLAWALFTLLLFALGCTANWIAEATNIIALLVPAAGGILGIITALGTKVPPDELAEFTKWSTEAQGALTQLSQLIQQYNTAEASAQPGILGEIDAIASTLTTNLSGIEATLHITNPATQAKVTAVIELFSSELTALLNLIPVLKGTAAKPPTDAVTDPTEVHDRLVAVLPAKKFRHAWNSAVDEVSAVAPEVPKGKWHVG